jgi:predicted MFS family arabinose efflux permease
LLRDTRIARIVCARFLSRAGSEAAFFVGIWGKAAFMMGAGPQALAALMFVLSVASILGTTLGGVLVDRYGPRRVLVVSEIVFVPAALAIAAADDMRALTLLVAVWALVGAPVVTASASFAPFLVSERFPLQRLNAWIEGAASFSFAVGPGLGALLVRYANVNWVFVLDAATSLVAAMLIGSVALDAPARASGGRDKHAFGEYVEGLKIAYGRRNLRYYMLTGMVVWLAFGSFGALEPLFFRDVVGTGVEAMGWMNSIFGAGFVFGASLVARLPKKAFSARGLAAFVALTGMGTALYVGVPDLRVIAVGAFVWSCVIGLMEPLMRTLMHRDTPQYAIGRVMGTSEVVRRVGEVVPLAFAPFLATRFGVQATLIGGGFVATAAAVLSLPEARAIDRETAPGAAAAEIQGPHAVDEPRSPNP